MCTVIRCKNMYILITHGINLIFTYPLPPPHKKTGDIHQGQKRYDNHVLICRAVIMTKGLNKHLSNVSNAFYGLHIEYFKAVRITYTPNFLLLQYSLDSYTR